MKVKLDFDTVLPGMQYKYYVDDVYSNKTTYSKHWYPTILEKGDTAIVLHVLKREASVVLLLDKADEVVIVFSDWSGFNEVHINENDDGI
jgi:hypothetical protein